MLLVLYVLIINYTPKTESEHNHSVSKFKTESLEFGLTLICLKPSIMAELHPTAILYKQTMTGAEEK